MTPEAIIEIMRRFNVAMHYRASAGGGPRRYAVFAKNGQVTEQLSEPASHAEAQRVRDVLIAEAIMALAGKENAHV